MSTTALDTLAALTSGALALTDLMRTAQALGREPTDAEVDAALDASMAQHQRARQMVEVARQREQAVAAKA